MDQNQNLKIQKLLKELSLLEQTFINNVTTPSDLQSVKRLASELYLLSDISLSEKEHEPLPSTLDKVLVAKQINDFYNPVDMTEDLEHDSSDQSQVVKEEFAPEKIIEAPILKEPVLTEVVVEDNVVVDSPIEPPVVIKPETEKVNEPEVSTASAGIQFTKLLPLSKKFEYTRGLFGGDGSKLEAFLKEASAQGNKNSTKGWFNNQIASNGWGNKPDMCEELLTFLQRHLP